MLRLDHISKSFPGVKALDNISLEFYAGEVHALCGENGAGKSTLMNIITGNLQPDKGAIYWNQEPVQIRNVQHARNLGVGIVYQERSLIDTLSIAENIFPGNQPLTRWGTISYQQLYDNTQNLLDRLNLSGMSPRTEVRRLSPPQKQMVEIAKALATEPKLLILDEPTASITEKETKILFDIIRQLKQQQVCVIYISHRMAEIQQIADRVSVLKDGTYQGTVEGNNTTIDALIHKMVGRTLQKRQYKSHAKKEVVLKVDNLSGKGFRNVSFQLYKGEILGFAGLVGAGRTELAKAIFGAGEISSGEIWKGNVKICPKHPDEAMQQGIAYVPEERKSLGLFMDNSIADNIISAHLRKGLFKPSENERIAEGLRKSLDIKTPSVRQKAGKLSGGNQQKVVLAKWLNTSPDILIVDEPTHGVDVGAKAEIYNILKKLTADGKSVILISNELPELLLMADRIAVMCLGELTTILDQNEADEEVIMRYATIRA